MTLNEIAYNLLNIVRGGNSNHDESISLEQLKFNILHYRAMFIRRDYAQNGFTSRHIEQDLGCVELEKVDGSRCCDVPLECPVYRTKLPLPKTVRYNFSEALTYIGSVSGLDTFPLVNSNMVRWLSYDKYTKNNMKSFMIDEHLYIYNAQGIENVNIRGVFEDPRDVSRFGDCGGTGCYEGDETADFPIPMDMIQRINQGVLAGELKIISGTVSDTTNDRMQDPQTGMGGGAPQQQG